MKLVFIIFYKEDFSDFNYEVVKDVQPKSDTV